MGRKIPAKKHRGVRDPLEQRRQKFLQIKDKINHPPEKLDHQDISNQMRDFIKLRNEMKNQGHVQKRKPAEDLPKNAKRPYKDLPAFKMRPGEKPRTFMNRVSAVTSNNMKEAQFEAKYNVDVIRNEKGEVKVKKRSEAEMLELGTAPKSKKKGNNRGKDGEKDEEEGKEAGHVKTPVKGIRKKKERFDKKKLKREKKAKIREELEAEKKQMYQREDIKFGEIAHAPPTLNVIPRRGEKHETVARPGKKALLLNSLIGKKDDNPKKLKSKDLGIRIKTGKVDLKGKRKDLPMRTREALEDEQRSVMQQYREMKKQKLEGQSVPL